MSLTSKELIALWRLSLEDRLIAHGAVQRVRAYRRWFHSGEHDDHETGFRGETAGEFVDREMADRTTKERCRVLQVAVALTYEQDVDLTTRSKDSIKQMRRTA